MIVIIDFGSQTTHLIVRRIKELGAKAQIILPEKALIQITALKPQGIILSGGPASVYEKNAPTIDQEILNLNIPILGICYGMQIIAYILNGQVKTIQKKEFGPAVLTIVKNSLLFNSIPQKSKVWMSHGDEVIKLPPEFATAAKTETSKNSAIVCEKKRIYAVQFHPEVVHTYYGQQILKNFLQICGQEIKRKIINQFLIENIIKDIKCSIADNKAVLALSGGIDSSVAAILTHRAIGSNLTGLYIDSGLMRKNETRQLQKIFQKHYWLKIKIIKAKNIFLKKLKGISSPEKKRQIIGRTFIEVLEKEAQKLKAQFLVQGTIYPDVIESAGTKHSHKIKSHHNVAGLPKKMKLTLVEPLRDFYKDEVRKIGQILKLPKEILKRQPFPGPGLAIRIIGNITEKKLNLVRRADLIIQQEIAKAKLNTKLWQAFAVLTGIKTTGVRGDNRAYGETIAIRAIEAKDAMTAYWSKLPYSLLDKISTRIVNEIRQVNRVVYDITNKPPGTMEWE